MLWDGVPEQTAPKSGYDDADDGMDIDATIEMVFQPPLEKYLMKYGGSEKFYKKMLHPYIMALSVNGYIEVANADAGSKTIIMTPKLKDWSDGSLDKWVKGVKHIVDEINLYVV